jgi:transcriptional regulator with XRE-family HTH domain
MRASKAEDSTPAEARRGPDMFLNTSQVKTIMRLAGWNRAELARQMNMDQSAINRLLDGELQPGHKSIASLLVAIWRRFEDTEVGLGELFHYVDEDGRPVKPPHASRDEPDEPDEPAS